MSLYDWKTAKELRDQDVPFYALIMAAMLKADTRNADLLVRAFPDTAAELERRYHSRLALNGIAGALPEDAP